jgi:hypothetical protein
MLKKLGAKDFRSVGKVIEYLVIKEGEKQNIKL